MLSLGNNKFLVTSASELPQTMNAKRLYLDVETTSFRGQVDGLSSWHGGRICGVAVTVDDCERAWYIPVRHDCPGAINVPLEAYQAWLADTLRTCERWDNHNVKFDAHMCAADGAFFGGKLFCTLAHARLIDSDRGYGRGTYALDSLAKDWLKKDISPLEEALQPYVKFKVGKKNVVDYGACPTDIMAQYACDDVITTRELSLYEEAHCSERSRGVWETETLLTPVLFDMERDGIHVHPQELKTEEFKVRASLLMIEEAIHRMIGMNINPVSNDDCYELLCCRYGLPVLAWTNEGKENKEHNPSFDADALLQYLEHTEVQRQPGLRQVVQMMLKYRELHTLLSLFITKFIDLNVDGVLHPNYHQVKRTGRMACGDPNMQQNSPASKALIHPPPGEAFLSYDYSQIEFRLIVHYINNQQAIAAYAENPDTDFHTWVAEMCGIPRKPAKNINFAIAFGGGKKRIVKMLAGNASLVQHLYEEIDAEIAAGKIPESLRMTVAQKRCQARGEEVFNKYHQMLPELKRTANEAATNLRVRGYVFNAYGRERRLPRDHAHKAFNNVIQSCAADVMKERTVALAPRYNSFVRSHGIRMRANVHDELLFSAPLEVARDPRVQSFLALQMEDTAIKFRVPLRVSAGISEKSWGAVEPINVIRMEEGQR